MHTSASRSPGSGGRSGGYSVEPVRDATVDGTCCGHRPILALRPTCRTRGESWPQLRQKEAAPCAGNATTRRRTCEDYFDELRDDDAEARVGGAIRRKRPDPVRVHDRTARLGLSELLITGVSPQRASRLLNASRGRDARTGADTRPADQATGRTAHRDRRSGPPRRAPRLGSCVRRPRNSRAAVGVGRWPRPLAVVSRILRRATTATRARHPVEGCVSEPVLRPQLSDPGASWP